MPDFVSESASPLQQVLAGFYLSLFLPPASVTDGLVVGTPLFNKCPCIAALIADGIAGVQKQMGRASTQALTDALGPAGFPVRAVSAEGLFRLAAQYGDQDPLTNALLVWVFAGWSDDNQGGSGIGGAGTNLVTIDACGQLVLSTEVSAVAGPSFDRVLPPFWKFLSCVIVGLQQHDNDDVAAEVLWLLASVAQTPCPYDMGIKTSLPLPNVVRALVKQQTMLSPERMNNRRSLRSMTVRALLYSGSTVQVTGFEFLPVMLQALAGYQENPVLRALQAYAGVPKTRPLQAPSLTYGLEAVQTDASSNEDAQEGAGSSTEADPDSQDDAYRPADENVGNKDLPVQGAASYNSMRTSNGDNDTIDLVSLRKGPESANGYYYRRAISSLKVALGNDPDAEVSPQSRKTLSRLCQSWLWLADIGQVKTLVKQLGLSRFLKPVGSSV